MTATYLQRFAEWLAPSLKTRRFPGWGLSQVGNAPPDRKRL
ncbi:MAG: hypothetical protein WCA35_26855 [Kovacikia sp.]